MNKAASVAFFIGEKMKIIFLLFLLVFYSSYSYSAYYYVVASSASGDYSSLDQAISKEKAYLQGFNEIVGEVEVKESTAIKNHGSVYIYYKPYENYSYYMKHSFTWWIKEDYCSTSSARSDLNNKINECFDNTPLNNEASHNYYCSEDAVATLGSCTYTPIDDDCTGDACGGDGSGEGGEGGDGDDGSGSGGDGSGSGGDGSGSGGDGSGSGGDGSGSGGDGSGSGGGGSGSGGDGSGSGGDGSDGQGSGGVDLSPVLNKLGSLQSTVDQNASTIKAALKDAQSANTSALADIESATRGLGSDLAGIESATRGLGGDLSDIADSTASTATRVNNLAESNRNALAGVEQATTDAGNKLSVDLNKILDADKKINATLEEQLALYNKYMETAEQSRSSLEHMAQFTEEELAVLREMQGQFMTNFDRQYDQLAGIHSAVGDMAQSISDDNLTMINQAVDEFKQLESLNNTARQSADELANIADLTKGLGDSQVQTNDKLDGVKDAVNQVNDTLLANEQQESARAQEMIDAIRDSALPQGELEGLRNSVDAIGDDVADIGDTLDGIAANQDALANLDVSGAGVVPCFQSNDCHGFYTSKYPDGISGIMTAFTEDLRAGDSFAFLDQFNVDIGNAAAPDFEMNFNLGKMGNFGTHSFNISPDVWLFIRLCIMFGAAILARALVFGG